MAFVTPRTWVSGAVVVASELNQDVRDNVDFLHKPPAARVFHSAAQSIAHATWTKLAFDSERFDTDGMHDTVTNNERLTVVVAGRHYVRGNAEFAGNNTGERGIRLIKNNLTLIARFLGAVAGASPCSVVVPVFEFFPLNDFVEVEVFQGSGAALDVNATAQHSPYFEMFWQRS